MSVRIYSYMLEERNLRQYKNNVDGTLLLTNKDMVSKKRFH